MAPNKFATILHRKTNKITLVLVYVVLEWVLIFLLLLNSLFSYLIIRFAQYFGLKTPCLLCSRLDHILEPHNSKSSYRELICEQHAIELSRSGYCFNHQKLVESQDMCENCSFSHLHNRNKHPSAVSVFRWLKEVGVVKSDDDCLVAENDNDDVNLRCSCCGVTINSYILSPALMANRGDLLYPSDCDEEPDQNGVDSLGTEDQDTDRIMGLDSDLINEDANSDGFSFWLPKRGYSMGDVDEEEEQLAVSKAEKKPVLQISTKGPYANERLLPQDVEFYIDLDDYQLVPVKMVNSETKKSENESQVDQNHGDENMVDMLPTIGDEAEETTREVKCRVVGDQAHDVQVSVDDDQVTEETELNELNVNLPTTDVGDGNHVENNETEVENLPTQQGQDMVELEETKMKEDLSNKSDEEEIKIDVQLGAYDVQVPEITELKALKADIPTSENNKTKAEDIPTKVCNKLEIMELNNTKTKELLNGKIHEEEKREVDDTEFIDTNKQFQFSGDQAHDVPMTAFDDQVTEETEFNQVKSNIASSNVGDVYHGENETEVVKLPTKQGQDMELKGEIVVEVELEEIRMKEVLINKGDEEDIKIDVQILEETQVKEPNADVPTSENDETMSENMLTEVGDELEIMELDSTKTKELLNEKVHEEEKREVDDTEFIDTNKQFHVSVDQSHDVPITAFDDQVTETEFNQVKFNIASSDFEDLCNKENEEIDTLKSLELRDKSQMVEPSIVLLENGDFELIHQTEESHEHNYIRVEIREQELLYDPAMPREPNEERPFSQRMELDDQETLEKSVADALSALHAELEEERNAAAIATNQTMLMISRLQEEKATIEMEALQYQRMMEEQSEYDQEALQLMNEILVKREKELQEAEKELEICRKKLAENEERERTRLMSQRKNRSCTKGRNSSASCSNGEESDGLSVEMNNESREENSLCRCEENGHHEDTPDDAILNLDDSMSIFEEERVSILEQLKVLEEKLCALSEEKEHQSQNSEQFEQFNGDNGDSNGIEKWKMNGQKPKQLLPLFNEAEMQSDDDELSILKSSPTKFELENKRLAIEEEVDHMYDRLHALEADREFIKHCIGSLSKGDRGVHLLQEILQHLRDLKNVELQSRNVYGLC
ncbi:hypothetical protein V2J09_020581 [Rumex salicifolius]